MEDTVEQIVSDIKTALSSDNHFFFSHLIPRARELAGTEYSAYAHLLEIFSAGDYGAYIRESTNLPSLSSHELEKLRILCVVNISSRKRSVTFDELSILLGMSSPFEIQRLLIKCIQNGMLSCSIDEGASTVYLEQAIGTDISTDYCSTVISTLESWSKQCGSVTDLITENVTQAAKNMSIARDEEEIFLKKLDSVRNSIRRDKFGESSSKSRKLFV